MQKMVFTHKEVFELLRLCVTKEKVTVGMSDLVQGQVRSAKQVISPESLFVAGSGFSGDCIAIPSPGTGTHSIT